VVYTEVTAAVATKEEVEPSEVVLREAVRTVEAF